MRFLLKSLVKRLIDLRAARLIHKLPTDMEGEAVLTNASWMPLKYFYCYRILAHKSFYNLDLNDVK